MIWLYKVSRLRLCKLCPQHNHYNDKTSVTFALRNGTLYFAHTGELYGVFRMLYKEKNDCDIYRERFVIAVV